MQCSSSLFSRFVLLVQSWCSDLFLSLRFGRWGCFRHPAEYGHGLSLGWLLANKSLSSYFYVLFLLFWAYLEQLVLAFCTLVAMRGQYSSLHMVPCILHSLRFQLVVCNRLQMEGRPVQVMPRVSIVPLLWWNQKSGLDWCCRNIWNLAVQLLTQSVVELTIGHLDEKTGCRGFEQSSLRSRNCRYSGKLWVVVSSSPPHMWPFWLRTLPFLIFSAGTFASTANTLYNSDVSFQSAGGGEKAF